MRVALYVHILKQITCVLPLIKKKHHCHYLITFSNTKNLWFSDFAFCPLNQKELNIIISANELKALFRHQKNFVMINTGKYKTEIHIYVQNNLI